MKKLFTFLLLAISLLLQACDSASESAAPGTGRGGSMARFTVAGNTLYRVGPNHLPAYNISDPADPRPGNRINLGMGVETIFPYGNHLFIGTQTGMFIFDIQQPQSPRMLSVFNHIQSCDPVVAQGNFAYVTLRSGTDCRNTSLNTLDVVDIQNPAQPKLFKSYPMLNPHGLAIDGNLLFVSEGEHGLKVFDATNPGDLRELQFLRGIRTYDLIPDRNTLIVTGASGIFQYNYDDPRNLKLISSLPIEP